MPGRWSDERERAWNERRSEADWRNEPRWDGREARSFDREERVFGERESGAGYNRPQRDVSDYRSRGRAGDGAPTWQERDYGGVSPGFRAHEHDYDSGYRANPRFERQDYTRGDDGRGRAYGGDSQQGRRFGTREADERYDRALGRDGPYAGGGQGAYDDERSYGEGRRDFEDRARDAGDFFRRTGRRVANWFSEVAGEPSEMGRDEPRGARGLGPKGYKRSDERICDDANQRLTDDPWLDASDIDLTVSAGEVTLNGMVENREAKHRAESLVEHLTGVNHVQNNLRVKSAGTFASSGRGYSDGLDRVRTEGDASMETSANATGTTTRKTI